VQTSPDTLTIRRPDDWHAHLRDGAMLGRVAGYTARCIARAIIMPNLVPPMTTATAARECYAQMFDEENALDRFEGFASEYGARFYGLPLNQGTLTLARDAWEVPETLKLPLPDDQIVPFGAGATLAWRVETPQGSLA